MAVQKISDKHFHISPAKKMASPRYYVVWKTVATTQNPVRNGYKSHVTNHNPNALSQPQ